MKEPQRPYPPYPFQYKEKVERQYIYRFTESLREDDDGWDDEDKPKEEYIPIDEVNLEWLASQVPQGISPNQIKIEFGYNASSMAYEDHYVRFYYEVTIPAKPEEYEAACQQYEKDLEQYGKDLVAHQDWKVEQEIQAAEETLKRLKK